MGSIKRMMPSRAVGDVNNDGFDLDGDGDEEILVAGDQSNRIDIFDRFGNDLGDISGKFRDEDDGLAVGLPGMLNVPDIADLLAPAQISGVTVVTHGFLLPILIGDSLYSLAAAHPERYEWLVAR